MHRSRDGPDHHESSEEDLERGEEAEQHRPALGDSPRKEVVREAVESTSLLPIPLHSTTNDQAQRTVIVVEGDQNVGAPGPRTVTKVSVLSNAGSVAMDQRDQAVERFDFAGAVSTSFSNLLGARNTGVTIGKGRVAGAHATPVKCIDGKIHTGDVLRPGSSNTDEDEEKERREKAEQGGWTAMEERRRCVVGGQEEGGRGGTAVGGRAMSDGRVGTEEHGQQAQNGMVAHRALERGQMAALSIETNEPGGDGGGQEQAEKDASRPTMFRCVSMSQLEKVPLANISRIVFFLCVWRCIDE